MITLKEWMEVVDYRITEGSEYYGYGGNAYCLDSWNGKQDGYSLSITFDTRTQAVYKVEAHDYVNKRSYRRLNDQFEHSVEKEAYDEVDFVDLEVDDDWFQKALSIVAGEDYDTRVSVPIDMGDAELLKYMMLAHEQDITFNELVTKALTEAIKGYDLDPEAAKQRAQDWINRD
jgi:hypothetical protein